ncbi:ATP-dependent DNA ligase [Actinocorallia populi]|uniref:ATP-dependent DNA ligase n=1 Tax=Actinocorallia populi TaxID=2079200 RepID=UPI000D08D681|nr:ATP-dependent DNA ligase [Actinocorallia populi]
MLLAELAAAWRAVSETSARREKTALIAACLRDAGPEEAPLVVHYLAGELPQRQIGIGPSALGDRPTASPSPGLSVSRVDAVFSEIKAASGPGSVAGKRRLLRALLAEATGPEQEFLVRLLAGDLRQGALEGVMTEAIAKAAGIPAAAVRRAVMLRGSLSAVAVAALSGGAEALSAFTLRVGRPVRPMLASSAPSLEEALKGEMALEWKMDGIRAQLHVEGEQVRVFTRTLEEITSRVPEVVERVRALGLRSAILDGELIALREDGRPHPFQVTSARAATRSGGIGGLSLFAFDVLHLDGVDLLDEPGSVRGEALVRALPEPLRMPRTVTAELPEAEAFLAGALARGHEGVLLKSLGTPYTAGRRGAGWIKVKPRHTLDLVVLAVERGSGRRRGTLSNLHLGARDPRTGGFVMLGKTFKGLTDRMLAWQTERFTGLKTADDGWTVTVRPVQVVEIAFDGLQRSPRYPGGLALRFARVLRYRSDKTAEEADTIDTVRALAGFEP